MDQIMWIALFLKIAVVLACCMGSVPFLVWFERRGSAWIQGRVGPNRVGPFGLLQSLADVLKFFFKEDFAPKNASRIYYYLAPMIALIAPLGALTMIPFGSYVEVAGQVINLQIAEVNAGVLFILAFAGLEVYPIILAGWASNNKYSVFGALRGSSQIVSYEISMGLALVSMLLAYGTLDLHSMVEWQSSAAGMWGCVMNPIGALIFWICTFAETNRLPFDLPEGEAEIVAGFHVEYGSMKFALFFLAEYVAMIMASALLATVFFGGYSLLPGFSHLVGWVSSAQGWPLQNVKAFFEFASLFLKVAFFMFVFVWVRWTLPRFRFDQLMDLGWKILFPLAMLNLGYMVALVTYLARSH
ncbi:MAG: NADH-quinone oxidoreductase subunit NuoH [Bacteriovoracaceae bacterium]|nr:NADH-quinone oxidoreductase subunit NuoH [Bacteriovoracaceae bacterium]